MIQIDISSFAYAQAEPLFQDLQLKLDSTRGYILKGENGCGKSTLMNILSGRQLLSSKQKDGFSFVYRDRDVEPGEASGQLFFLPQDPNAGLLGLCARQDLEIWQMALPQIDIVATIEAQAASTILDMPYTKLSSGQLRLVSQLVLPYLKDRYWFLDEAFAGLDRASTNALVELLKAKLESGPGYWLVSHEDLLATALDATLI